MAEPIKCGDECIVIGGAFFASSFKNTGPNRGKRVTVKALRGEHSVHGRIWRCTGEDLVTEYGAKGSEADFAQSWLKKADPQAPGQSTTRKDLEHSS